MYHGNQTWKTMQCTMTFTLVRCEPMEANSNAASSSATAHMEGLSRTKIKTRKLVKHSLGKPSSYLPRLGLGEHVSQIVLSGDVANGTHWLRPGTSLSHVVVGNAVALLLQLRLWLAAVVHNRHVVSIHTSGTFQGNPHHPELVTKSSKCVPACFHCNELCAKH